VDAVLSAEGEWFTYDFPKTDLTYSLLMYPGLSNAGRLRLESTLNLRRELFHDFSISISAYDSFDNRPPTEGVSHNDVGLTLSVGWSF